MDNLINDFTVLHTHTHCMYKYGKTQYSKIINDVSLINFDIMPLVSDIL